MLNENEEANNARIISRYTASQVKELYRRLAKMLHPDISPLCRQYQMLNELFNRVIVAYKCNDLKELQKLEVLVNKELEKNGVDNFSMVIPDIDERISELEQDIDKIVTSEPYIYKKLLNDVDAVEKKKDAINKEINEYTSYKCELNEKLIVLKEENING